MTQKPESHAEELLSVIEHMLRDDSEIIADVERLKQQHPDSSKEDLAEQIVTTFSNKSALSGGASALPALIPGWGTIVTMVGGALLDTALLLKFEVEMTLSLCWLYGFDIRDRAERQMAFLLASISTYDVRNDGNFVVDVMQAEGVAIWNYAPRQVSKVLLIVLGRLALASTGKSMLRALPLVGIAIGSGMNKILTMRVGENCVERLSERFEIAKRIATEQASEDDDVVDAVMEESESDEI